MNHIVYFLGGPLDLTKRAFHGAHPDASRLRFPVYPDKATYHGPNSPIRAELHEIEYELAPIYRNRAGTPVAWAAVYVE